MAQGACTSSLRCFLIIRVDAQPSFAAKNEEPCSGPYTEASPAATGGTPTTALARLPAYQAQSRFDARAAAREDTVDLARGGGFGEMQDNGLPGSSVLRHRVSGRTAEFVLGERDRWCVFLCYRSLLFLPGWVCALRFIRFWWVCLLLCFGDFVAFSRLPGWPPFELLLVRVVFVHGSQQARTYYVPPLVTPHVRPRSLRDQSSRCEFPLH